MLHFGEHSNAALNLSRQIRLIVVVGSFSSLAHFIFYCKWHLWHSQTHIRDVKIIFFSFPPFFASLFLCQSHSNLALPLSFLFSCRTLLLLETFPKTISKVIIFCQWKALVSFASHSRGSPIYLFFWKIFTALFLHANSRFCLRFCDKYW